MSVLPRIPLVAIAVCLLSSVVLADNRPIPPNSKMFIDEVDGDLDGFIRAEITKEKVPVRLVVDRDAADLIMIGSSADKKGKVARRLADGEG